MSALALVREAGLDTGWGSEGDYIAPNGNTRSGSPSRVGRRTSFRAALSLLVTRAAGPMARCTTDNSPVAPLLASLIHGLGGFGFSGGIAQYVPLHIRPQVLAQHRLAPLASGALDIQALLRGYAAVGVEPWPHGPPVGVATYRSDGGLPAQDVRRPLQREFFRRQGGTHV